MKDHFLDYKWVKSSNILLLIASLGVLSCFQGRPSEDPPIHVNPNMDNQEKYLANESSNFFADGATNRMPIPGIVATNEFIEDFPYYLGKEESGQYVTKSPVPFTTRTLARGQQRYKIYCAPCHGRVGDGKGIVVNRGYMPPPTFHSANIRSYPDGQIFDIISNGIRNMPSYRHQIQVEDRWAIVAYFRALQRAQNASINDIPTQMRNEIK